MPTTFNLARARGKYTRAGRSTWIAGYPDNDTAEGYDRTAEYNKTRHYVRRGRAAYLDGRSAP